MRTPEQRFIDLEAGMRVLQSRVICLEETARITQGPAPRPVPRTPQATTAQAVRTASAPAAPQATPQAPQAPARPPAARAPHSPRPRLERAELEDLLGGRVLAWLGGLAVVLGLAFFFALAISRGWIDETTRTLLAAAGSLAVLGAGVWLREKRGHNEAAMAAAATGLAGLFLTIVVAAQVYDLVAALPALLLAMITGAAGTCLALRWNAPVIAAIGTLGAALAPALAGADSDGTTIALLFVAAGAGTATLVYRRWSWLGLALFCIVTPQWVPWVATEASAAGGLLALAAFGTAGLLTAIGFELRAGTDRLLHSSAFLLVANSLVLSVAGWICFDHAHLPLLGKLWLAGLAVVHVGAGGSMRLERRISRELAVLSIALGVVLADVAWASVVGGPGIAVGWALSAIGFAWTTSRKQLRAIERQAAAVGLGGQVAIALGHVLVSDLSPSALSTTSSLDAVFAVVALAAACLISGRFAEDGNPRLRAVIDAVGLASIAYATAATLDGAALVAALAGQACLLAVVARVRNDSVAAGGALAFLGMAALHALAVEAPPGAFLYGAGDTAGLLVAVGAVALAAARLGSAMPLEHPWPRRLKAGAAIAALYGASVAIVTAFQPGAGAAVTTALDLGVRQEGHMLVSGLWSLTGAAALVAGLTRDNRDLRVAGLSLLAASVAKVFLFDLATLASVYRVISFVGLGVVLLGGSYAWQRLRPAPLPDLREV